MPHPPVLLLLLLAACLVLPGQGVVGVRQRRQQHQELLAATPGGAAAAAAAAAPQQLHAASPDVAAVRRRLKQASKWFHGIQPATQQQGRPDSSSSGTQPGPVQSVAQAIDAAMGWWTGAAQMRGLVGMQHRRPGRHSSSEAEQTGSVQAAGSDAAAAGADSSAGGDAGGDDASGGSTRVPVELIAAAVRAAQPGSHDSSSDTGEDVLDALLERKRVEWHEAANPEEMAAIAAGTVVQDPISDGTVVPDASPSPAPPGNSSEAAVPPPALPSNATGLAAAIDKALAKEFDADTQKAASEAGKNFNETVTKEEGNLETVVRISAKGKKEKEEKEDEKDGQEAGSTAGGEAGGSTADGGSQSSATGGGAGAAGAAGGGAAAGGSGAAAAESGGGSAAAGGGAGAGAEAGTEGAAGGKAENEAEEEGEAELPTLDKDVDRLIDSHDNEFVLSASKGSVSTLTLDPVLIQDLTFVISAAAACGAAFEAVRQPVINGYLVAGAIVGPGGFKLIKELVQVQSLAQLGVQLLLFRLGRELSFAKLRAVWGAALLGGVLQIAALMLLGGMLAALTATSISQGVFVGALLSMSSTSVVVKCLEVTRATGSAYGQITIGTLILQDCAVGVMFALMPAFGSASLPGGESGAASWAAMHLVMQVMIRLGLFMAATLAVARTLLPVALRILLRHGSEELVQLGLVATCLSLAWLSGELELSEELGAFIAGAMVAVAESTLAAQQARAGAAAGSVAASKGSGGKQGDGGGGGGSSANGSEESQPLVGGAPLSPPARLITHGSFSMAQAVHALDGHGGGGTDGASPSHRRALAGGNARDEEHAHCPDTPPEAASARRTSSGTANSAGDAHGGVGRSRGGGGGHGSGGHGGSGGGHGGGGAHGGSSRAYQLEAPRLESVTNIMTALFVGSMGLIMSPVFLAHHALVLTLGTLVVMVVKTAITAGVVHMFGVPWHTAFAVGLSMAHIGEFSFVLLSLANQLQLLSPQAYMLLLGVTAMSLLTTPMVIMMTSRLLQRGDLRLCGNLRMPLRLTLRRGGGSHLGGHQGSSSVRTASGCCAEVSVMLGAEGRDR